MSATRSDGVSIAWVLEHSAPPVDELQNRLAGHVECRDPECPEWQQHVEKHDSFWRHFHAVPVGEHGPENVTLPSGARIVPR